MPKKSKSLEILTGIDRQQPELANANRRGEALQSVNELLPKAAADFRLGQKRFDEKLAFTLQSSLTRQQIRKRAE